MTNSINHNNLVLLKEIPMFSQQQQQRHTSWVCLCWNCYRPNQSRSWRWRWECRRPPGEKWRRKLGNSIPKEPLTMLSSVRRRSWRQVKRSTDRLVGTSDKRHNFEGKEVGEKNVFHATESCTSVEVENFPLDVSGTVVFQDSRRPCRSRESVTFHGRSSTHSEHNLQTLRHNYYRK